MTSATTNRPRGAGGRHADGRGLGLILFAAVLLFVVGFFNIIYGIAAIANSHVFVADAHYVFANRAWGWITLIIGVLLLIAAGGVLAGNQLARWFAVAVVGLNAIDMMFFIPAYPFWALTIIAVDVVALSYGLCAYGTPRRTWARLARDQRLVGGQQDLSRPGQHAQRVRRQVGVHRGALRQLRALSRRSASAPAPRRRAPAAASPEWPSRGTPRAPPWPEPGSRRPNHAPRSAPAPA